MNQINLVYFIKGCLEHPRFEEGQEHHREGEFEWLDYLIRRAQDLEDVLELFAQRTNDYDYLEMVYELVEELAVNEFFDWYFGDRSTSLKDRLIQVASDWYEFDMVGYLADQKEFDCE